MPKYNAVIFDLDGTILNTLSDLGAALNYALERYGRPTRTLGEVRSFLGNGLRRLIARALPQGEDDPDYEAILDENRRRYAEHSQDTTVPYPGITEMLDALAARGVAVGVVTNKPHVFAEPMVQNNFGARVALTIGKKDGWPPKPAPDSLNEALSILGVDASEAIYVGDTEVDLETAENAGMPCLLVSWGYRDRDVLEKLPALGLIDSPEQLLDYIGE